MKPLKDRIFAEILPETETDSGIVLMGSNLDKHRCRVLSVGPGVKSIRQGQVLRYDHNISVSYEDKGKKFVFLRESDPIFIISDGHNP